MNRQCFSATITTVPRGVSTLHTDASGTAPPDAFGPFRVLHQIGVGALGPVYRAYQPDPGRLVAVKLFRIDLQPDLALRFVASLDRLIAADLTHLGIAAPLAAGMVDGSPYLALDFVAAESFDVVIRDYGPAPAAEALRIATQLGGALDFAAAVNVVHGALHPRDVLVSTDDTRVTGLGIAQALDAVGIASPVRRPYTAPERVAGLPWDRRADIFSLAALVTEMLCGRRLAGTGQTAADAVPEIDGASMDALRSVIARALADDPADRFDTALGFVEGLHAAFTQPSASARPTPPRRRKKDSDAARTTRPGRTPERPAGVELPLTLGTEEEVTSPTPVVLPADVAAQLPPDALAEVEVEPHHDPVRPIVEPAVAARAAHEDLDLRHAEDDRYAVVESAPAVPRAPTERSLDRPVDADVPPRSSVHARPALLIDDAPSRVPSSAPHGAAHEAAALASAALTESRSAVWPIVLALIVGGLVGFALGFGIGNRERGTAVPQVAERTAPAGQEPLSTVPVAPPESAVRTPQARTPSTSAGQPTPGTRTTPAPPTPQGRPAPERVAPEARDHQRGAAERAAADTGRLLVRSTPGGARVALDGRDVGATPVTLREVASGTHVVRITHQGYVAAERRVRISAAQPAQSIEVELVAARAVREAPPQPAAPERTSGSLMVESRPAGARVLVDGKLVGTTPLLLDAVSVGDHAVRLELDGFSPWTASAHVNGGDRARVSGSLEQR